MKTVLKRLGILLAILVVAALLTVSGYVIYMILQYNRIEDYVPLYIENAQTQELQPGQEYTAFTYNIGFGAYNPEFSFFMDYGEMQDGTPVQGLYGRAQSKDIVLADTNGAITEMGDTQPDFCLLQEVDISATRSFHVDQADMIKQALPNYASVFAYNFHSAYLAYPFHEPHGSVQAGLLTLSRYHISEAQRRSYPVDESFPTKFFDLDRCFAVLRVPVNNGRELVLINSHMSAYDEGGLVREKQLRMLNEAMEKERLAGNYVIVGGDFNHALCGTELTFPSQQKFPEWVHTLSDENLAEGFHVVCAENVTQVPTCRSADLPYEKGVNYTSVLDGFIVSDNLKATAENIDLNFAYSDHNPVMLRFSLNTEVPPV